MISFLNKTCRGVSHCKGFTIHSSYGSSLSDMYNIVPQRLDLARQLIHLKSSLKSISINRHLAFHLPPPSPDHSITGQTSPFLCRFSKTGNNVVAESLKSYVVGRDRRLARLRMRLLVINIARNREGNNEGSKI